MKEIYAILSIKIVFSIIGSHLHGVGIYTLKRNKWNNQVIILINLSTAEIIILINFIISDSMGFMEQSNENNTNVIINGVVGSKTLPEIYKQIYILILYFGGFEMQFLLMLLTVERLICILSPLHYHIVVEEKLIIQKLVLCSWLFSIMLSLLAFFSKSKWRDRKISHYYANHSSYIVFGIIYTYLIKDQNVKTFSTEHS